MTNIKSYSELLGFATFIERYKYLKLDGQVGIETFGSSRYINQDFYKSREWKNLRNKVIARDLGCDLALTGYDIHEPIIIHHINPITADDILYRKQLIFDLENVISTKLSTHNAIHYGDESLLIISPIERIKNDTVPWRK